MRNWVFNDKARIAAFVAEQVEQRSAWASNLSGYNAIGVEQDGEVVAGIVINGYNGANGMLHIGIRNSYSLPRDFLPTIFDWFFNQMKLKRVTAPIASSNKKSKRFTQHVGFALEHVMKDAHPDGDLELWVMFREQCRWIGEKRNG